jgi:hypothetical protein
MIIAAEMRIRGCIPGGPSSDADDPPSRSVSAEGGVPFPATLCLVCPPFFPFLVLGTLEEGLTPMPPLGSHSLAIYTHSDVLPPTQIHILDDQVTDLKSDILRNQTNPPL